MELHAMGMDYKHDRDFLVDRPAGSGDSLILIFLSPAQIRLNNLTAHLPAGSAVVFSGSFAQHYGADGQDYVNHWVHFDFSGEEAFIERIGLPLNTPIRAADLAAAESILKLLSIESISDGENAADCVDLLLRLLLSKLAEGAERGAEQGFSHRAALKELRACIYRTPSVYRSVEEMARGLSLSPSHFQHLYQREFGVSCYEDTIRARLDMAKYYLKTTALPVKSIAKLCGYENDVHFIRQFKKRTGMTAGAYRGLGII
ncbi:MAG: AraC family transcriptional regulator [Oscillospiraceae bacterium]